MAIKPPETKQVFESSGDAVAWVEEQRPGYRVLVEKPKPKGQQVEHVLVYYTGLDSLGKVIFVHETIGWRQMHFGKLYGDQFEIPKLRG